MIRPGLLNKKPCCPYTEKKYISRKNDWRELLLRSDTLKKLFSIIVLSLAVLALLAGTAFACGEKKTDAQKADCEKKVSSVNTAAACDDSGMLAGEASGEGDNQHVLRMISVSGMTGTGCEETISNALAGVEGVVEVVKVCHKSGQAMVRVDAKADIDAQLTKAITDAGYQANIIPAVAKSLETPKGPICPLSGGPGCGEPDSTKAAAKKDKE